MSIISARYSRHGNSVEVTPHDLNHDTYESTYKGYLFCPMPACNAKIEYVHRAGTTGYFRTWKHEDHEENCPHKFDRVYMRRGAATAYAVNVELSAERKSRALKDAFATATMSTQEREARKQKRKQNNVVRTRPQSRVLRPTSNLVQTGGIDEQEAKKQGVRGPKLIRKDADALQDSDVGRLRLVIGDLLDVAEEAGKAAFRIGKRNAFVQIRMEEAFFANSPNYQGLFFHAKDFLIENGSAIFTVIGEVQDRNAQGEYEVVVFHGNEFEIQGATLLAIAASYSRGLFGT